MKEKLFLSLRNLCVLGDSAVKGLRITTAEPQRTQSKSKAQKDKVFTFSVRVTTRFEQNSSHV